MICRRLALGMLAMLATLVFSAADIAAQEIRYFVVQSTGLFEILNVPTGGRFVRQPTSEYLNVSGHGTLRVVGYTDRAQRGENIVTQIRGQNVAFVQVTFTPQGGSTQTVLRTTCLCLQSFRGMYRRTQMSTT